MGPLLLLLAACGDNGLVIHNTEPEVTITNPGEGAVLAEGAATVLVASVTDVEDPIEDLRLVWTLDGSPLLGTATNADDVAQLEVDAGLEAGEHTVALTATDKGMRSGSDDVRFTVVADNAPSVSFVTPEADSASLAGAIAFDVLAADEDESDPAALTLSWSGSAAGEAFPTHPDSDGHARFFADLDAGDWTLSVTVADPLGATATALLAFSTVEGDSDGDDHVAEEFGGDDCDDAEAGAYPGADEVCDGVDDDCDGAIDEGLDADGDGVADCDDVEVCDGLDNDGDGAVDEEDAADPGTWYLDADADGYGSLTTIAACDMPAGYAASADDCDDAAATVFPGAAEICDGVDEDCDGAIDEGVTTTFYADADADGYGGLSTTDACSAPAGYVSGTGDCDDADATVSPAGTETCDDVDDDCDGAVDDGFDADADGTADCHDVEACDGLDNDGDGVVDEDDAADASTWYLDADGDGYGETALTTVSCSAPAGYVALPDDCDDAAGAIHPGATETDCSDPTDYNCDGAVGYADADGDGWAACEECDDAEGSVNPDATETCDGVDDDCDGTTDEADAIDASTWYVDTDADGFGDASADQLACDQPLGWVADDSDCDDTDASVRPSALETCDGVDDDCDGTVDEDDATDAPTWYADADADGFGVPTDTRVACAAPSGYVALDTDCDDASAAISPTEAEVCDGADTDEDCDGLADDADPTASGAVSWYADDDADGYGLASDTVLRCDAPAGWVADADDCDDTDADDHPAGVEVCNSDDEDCDGVVDDGVTTTFYADADGDGYGSSSTIEACSAPAGYVAVSGDCDDADGGAYPGAVETCDGADDDCDGVTDEDDASDAITWYRDADGDGYGVATTTAASCSAPTGYVATATDCDDAAASINPAAAELCDAADTDEDCDGLADDRDSGPSGTSTWYLDADGDGYGLSSATTAACDQPSGYVAGSTDCDDADAGDHPGGIEVCNSDDEDCDGTVDDGVTTTYYLDGDADGYGGTTTIAACSLPSGYVATSTDCDDALATVYPSAAEYCNSRDDDCDGTTDENAAVDASTWYADADADGYGLATSTSVSCTRPTGYVADATDCNDGSAAISPGDAEICDATNTDEDCDGVADDLDASATGQSTWYADADVDGFGDLVNGTSACDAPAGFVADATDCDDTAADVSPSGTEVCNSDDDDCDGTADDGATDAVTWHRDADTDTYGSATVTTASCTMPSGYVADGTDCDDASSSVNPAATEVCDASNTDEDCDSLADDLDSSVSSTGKTTYYRDADTDTYGVSTTSVDRCDRPTGYVTDSTDCDDADSADHPGGTEVCNSDDEDCDGTADDGVLITYYYDGDGDAYGVTSPTTTGCSVPSGYATSTTDCDDADADVNPGEHDYCGDGIDADCDGSDAACTFAYSGDYNAASVANYDAKRTGDSHLDYYAWTRAAKIDGDFDGDGYDDLVGGAWGDDYSAGGLTSNGSVYVESGPIRSGSATMGAYDVAWFRGTADSTSLGIRLAVLPDWDGDGDDELWIDRGGSVGSAYSFIYEGPFSGSYTNASGYTVMPSVCDRATGAGEWSSGRQAWACTYNILSTTTPVVYVFGAESTSSIASVVGESSGDNTGDVIIGGPDHDADGDGFDDLWITASGDDDNGLNAGAVYVVSGNYTGSLNAALADNKIKGDNVSDAMGGDIEVADIDGDGALDTLASATSDDAGGADAGAVYVFEDTFTDTRPSQAEVTIVGPAGEGIGTDFSVGDINADGEWDLLICDRDSALNGIRNQGTSFLLYGPLTGTLDLDTDYDARFFGDDYDDYVGSVCEMNGDLNGDGQDDMAIGGYEVGSSSSFLGAIFFFWGA